MAPADSPGNAVPPETRTGTVSLIDDDEDAALLEVGSGRAHLTTLDDVRTATETATKRSRRCDALFDHFTTLETWEGSSFTNFQVWAYAGIHNLRWEHLNDVHGGCRRPSVEFDGSIFAEAISNAGSSLSTHTRRSPLTANTEILPFGSDNVASTSVHWETSKVVFSYAFPVAINIDNYAPPVGNYRSEATATVRLYDGYAYSLARVPSRRFRYVCNKQGIADPVCSIRS
jgi:hypothetical protein